MSRKVFVSFLGTGGYIPCVYSSIEKGESKVVTYAQEAIVDLYCNHFSKNDKAYIFLTQEAEKKHWNTLKKTLDSKINLEGIKNVPEGYTEEEIWTIFELVYGVLKEEDEIILDVTHGFRSLPMLLIVLLNYAKSLKNIKVKAILYGAFEVLGPAYKVEEKYPSPKDRKAALLNLTSFSAIQEWTFGAESFIKTGNTNVITNMSIENITPILKETKGKDKTANSLRTVMRTLSIIEAVILTNRGKQILNENNVNTVVEELKSLSENNDEVIAPLKPILQKIEKKFEKFNEKVHWEAAVEWCIEHSLEQQGITQLQEGIISYVCTLINKDSQNLDNREIVAQSLNIAANNYEEEEWLEKAKQNKETVYTILKLEFVNNFNNTFKNLTELRNDINHGGYKANAITKPINFSAKLKEIYTEFIQLKSLK